jgi:hypothetical protein
VIDEIRLTFAALREGHRPEGDELAVRTLAATSAGILLGLDGPGRPHLLIRSDEPHVHPSGAAAIAISRRSLTVGGRTDTYVDVVCPVTALAEIFDHLVVAVIERVADGTDVPSAAVADVIEEWKRLLAAGGTGPSRDRLAAIFGELLVVCDLVRADPSRRLDAWVGPYGSRHDIRRGSSAIEVKTTRAHTARVVTVHGEDQLLQPEGGTLHLHLVRLEEVAGAGRSVPALADELITQGASPRDVFSAIEAAGLPPSDYPSADAVSFEVRERFTVPVDAASPRIVPNTFASGERPAGVIDLVYRVDLDHCSDRALSPQDYTRLIQQVGRAPS